MDIIKNFCVVIIVVSIFLLNLNKQDISVSEFDYMSHQNIVVEKDKAIQRLKEDNEKLNKERQEEIKRLSTECAKLENTVKKLSSVGKKPRNYNIAETVNRGSYERYKDSMTYVGEWLGTFYAPTKKECGNDKGLTASGKPVTAGHTIAVDNRYWKLGTKFYIEGFGYVSCDDTGRDIKGKNRFDFCVFSEDISHSGNFKAKVWIITD